MDSRSPFESRGIARGDDVDVFDEVAEMRVFVIADRGLHGDRLLGDLQYLAHLVFRHLHAFGQLVRGGLAPLFLEDLTRDPVELVDRLDHVHRDADGAGLVGDGAGDRLAYPPRGVGGKLVAAPVLELVDRLHEADVAFLDEIEELQPAVGVFLGDGDDEAQVRFHHLFLGPSRLGLAERHASIDVLNLAYAEPAHPLGLGKAALEALDVLDVLLHRDAVGIVLAAVSANPVRVRLAAGEGGDERSARHLRVVYRQLHDAALIGADASDRVAQSLGQAVQQLGGQLELQELVGERHAGLNRGR